MKQLKDIKHRIDTQVFPNNQSAITVDGRKTLEVVDIRYNYFALKLNKSDLVPAPIDEETVERDFIIKRSLDMVPLFQQEINVRRACFVNNYDGDDNHCLSYFQYNVRGDKLNLTVYVRSQNFITNFLYDNQTFLLAHHELYMKIKKFHPKLERGLIKVNTFSLHKYI